MWECVCVGAWVGCSPDRACVDAQEVVGLGLAKGKEISSDFT